VLTGRKNDENVEVYDTGSAGNVYRHGIFTNA